MPDKAVVTAKSDVKTDDLIKAVKAAGYGASVKKDDKKKLIAPSYQPFPQHAAAPQRRVFYLKTA